VGRDTRCAGAPPKASLSHPGLRKIGVNPIESPHNVDAVFVPPTPSSLRRCHRLARWSFTLSATNGWHQYPPDCPAAAEGSGRAIGIRRQGRRPALSSCQRHGPPGKPVAWLAARCGGTNRDNATNAGRQHFAHASPALHSSRLFGNLVMHHSGGTVISEFFRGEPVIFSNQALPKGMFRSPILGPASKLTPF